MLIIVEQSERLVQNLFVILEDSYILASQIFTVV
jgi:hypothetical protein